MQYYICLIPHWWSFVDRTVQCGIILYDLRSKHFVGLVSWSIYLQIFPFTCDKLQVTPIIQKENTITGDLHDIAYSTNIFKLSWFCKTHTNCCATPQATVHTTASVTQISCQCPGCLK